MNLMKILQFTHTWMRMKTVLVLIVLLPISSHAWTGGQETDPDFNRYRFFDGDFSSPHKNKQ